MSQRYDKQEKVIFYACHIFLVPKRLTVVAKYKKNVHSKLKHLVGTETGVTRFECQRLDQGILKGKNHCTVDLLFDWFGLVSFANTNKNCQLSYSSFQTSQTEGQWYSDTFPFSIP
jgi:hypothetical protein